jgi:hypothetical protein
MESGKKSTTTMIVELESEVHRAKESKNRLGDFS